MTRAPVLLALALLVSPAAAEEETIPSATYREVHDGWKDMIGHRVHITGGILAQAGMGPGYAALIEDASSDVIDIDTSEAIDPERMKRLEQACGAFLTADKKECQLDVVATIDKNPKRDVPVLIAPAFFER